MKQKQRSYQAFVREIKASRGLSQKEAQAAYRAMGERLGRSPAKADLSRHPRISSQVAKQAQAGQAPPSKREAKEIARIAAETRQKRSEASRRGHETRKAREAAKSAQAAQNAPKVNGLPAVPTTVRDLAQWDVYGYDFWEGADYEDFHAGAEYEYTD